MAIPSATLDEIHLPLVIIIAWEGNVRGYAVILLTLFSSSASNRCFGPWCLFGCNPLEILTPYSGPKGLQQRFAGVSSFCHLYTWSTTQMILSPFGFVKDMRGAEDGNPVLNGAFYSCIYISSSTASMQINFWSLEYFLRIVTFVSNYTLGWQCLHPRREVWDNGNRPLRLCYSILGWCLR